MTDNRIPWDFLDGDELEYRLKQLIDSKARNRARKTFRRSRLVRPLDPAREPKTDASEEVALAIQEALARLSPRERRVLDLDAAGFTDVEIAAQLRIHRNTVRNNRNRAYAKLRGALRHPR